MRKIVGLLWALVFILGLLGVFAGRLLVARGNELGGIIFWSGLVMMIIGWMMTPSAVLKGRAAILRRE
jgi:hypothetical protein